MERFYRKFGEFVCSCADAEAEAHRFLGHVLKIRHWKKQALTGGLQVSTIIKLIRRVVDESVRSQKRKAEIDKVLTHLDTITGFRNALVHRRVLLEEEGFFAHELETAKSHKKAREVKFSIDDLDAAIYDLLCIRMRLMMLSSRGFAKSIDAPQKKSLLSPWRFKPLAQHSAWNRLLAETLRHRYQFPTSQPKP